MCYVAHFSCSSSYFQLPKTRKGTLLTPLSLFTSCSLAGSLFYWSLPSLPELIFGNINLQAQQMSVCPRGFPDLGQDK